MNIISRKFHAVLDYVSGIILIVAPWALNFNQSDMATTVAVFAGVLTLLMSVMTNYEGGIARSIPMSIHLNMDILLGIFLVVSPWLFGFKNEVYLPHLIMGFLALFAGTFTERNSLTTN